MQRRLYDCGPPTAAFTRQTKIGKLSPTACQHVLPTVVVSFTHANLSFQHEFANISLS